MKQNKNNATENIVSGRLTAGRATPGPKAAGRGTYGTNRLGIVSNEESPGAIAPVAPSEAAALQSPSRPVSQVQAQQAGAAAPTGRTDLGEQTRPGPGSLIGQICPPRAHKDSAAGISPPHAPLRTGPVGATLPALPRAGGQAVAKPGSRTLVDDLWSTSAHGGGSEDAFEADNSIKQKVALICGGLVLIAAVLWACWPSGAKSGSSVPQAAQAWPAEVQEQPDAQSPVAAPSPTPAPEAWGKSSRPETADPAPGLTAGPPDIIMPQPQIDPVPGAIATKTEDLAAKPADQTPAQPIEHKYRPCPPGIKLTGIFQQSGRKVACINGRFRDVGDMVRGAKVLEIKEMSVEMELDGQRFLVGFGDPNQAPSDEDAPAPSEEDQTPPEDAPKAAPAQTQPAEPSDQPPARKKPRKPKLVDE